MKIDTLNSFHLTYCTNIHPGEEWSRVFANLRQYIPQLKARLAPDKPFGIGLRLADVATRELLQSNTLADFQSWLTEQDLYVFTLNGFPYGGFHCQVVKDQVYAPDWSKQERLDYTLRLVNILAKLLPAEMEGSISTLPLSYKPWFKGNQISQAAVTKTASLHIAQVVAEMVRIRIETEKVLHLDLEPEPDGLIENTAEVIDYFQRHLLPIGGAYLADHLEIPLAAAEVLLREDVRIYYDTCHFAVGYEEPRSVFQQFEAAGIQIGKIQISAALQVNIPSDAEQRRQVRERLLPFAESTYLHQVIARDPSGQLHHYPDLETALPYLEDTTACEWRIHFHVPIFIHDYQLLQSTQDDIVTVLELLHSNNVSSHLEIETYTWEVLLGQFPLFNFWGPNTSIRCSQWIADSAKWVEEHSNPTLTLIYLPHLDYCLQKFGPDQNLVAKDLQEIDALCGNLIEYYENRGAQVIVLSEYGITPVSQPVHLNRMLRQKGLLTVRQELGRELLDPGASKAFAVADHQIAHVYVNDPFYIPKVRSLLEATEGVAYVLDNAEKQTHHLNHPRSGELVAVSQPHAWFTYYYWLDDNHAPDFARTVDIHRKPGYDDPVELFLDPQLKLPQIKIGLTLLRKQLGFRYLMDVIPLDASLVRGSHGCVTTDAADGPLLMTRQTHLIDSQSIQAIDVCQLILKHLNG